jgi:phosphoribosyl 1,2-cyclic phosphate phosphodiesterase
VHGIDDLRQIVFLRHRRVPVWASGETQNELISRFGYAFVQPEGSPYPPILDLHTINGPVTVPGAGGPVTLTPFRADHGSMDALGFRIGPLAYLPDAVDIPAESWTVLEGLDCWIVDALQRKPHPTHAHLDLTLAGSPARACPRGSPTCIDPTTLKAEFPPHHPALTA